MDELRAQLIAMRIGQLIVFLLLVSLSVRCAHLRRPGADAQSIHIASVVAAGGVVDSIVPVAELLRRFRASAATPHDTLLHASRSVEELVTRWAAAIARSDTAELHAMALSRIEFGWLYYPEARISKPPYEAPPALLWGQIVSGSDKGLSHTLARLGDKRVRVAAVDCGARVEHEGKNRIRQECTTRLVVDGVTQPASRLFGSILERDGRFKFIGYSTGL